MSARTPLVLKDRATTPVSHTFAPDGEDPNGVHLFSEKTGVPATDPRFTAFLKRSPGKYKPTLRLAVPVSEVLIPGQSASIVRTAFAEISFTFDGMSTPQERKDCVGFVADALSASQVMINDLVVNLNDIYG